jgi:hypothetical protein
MLPVGRLSPDFSESGTVFTKEKNHAGIEECKSESVPSFVNLAAVAVFETNGMPM